MHTDVCDCYVLVADSFLFAFHFLFFLFSMFLTSVVIQIFLFFHSFVIFCTVYLE